MSLKIEVERVNNKYIYKVVGPDCILLITRDKNIAERWLARYNIDHHKST